MCFVCVLYIVVVCRCCSLFVLGWHSLFVVCVVAVVVYCTLLCVVFGLLCAVDVCGSLLAVVGVRVVLLLFDVTASFVVRCNVSILFVVVLRGLVLMLLRCLFIVVCRLLLLMIDVRRCWLFAVCCVH